MFFKPKRLEPRQPFTGPPGKRCYAIGDVHGRLDLLERILERIEADHLARSASQAFVVFLGDIIDRGPDSKGVVERLLRWRPGFASSLFIKGNHEEILVRGMTGEPELLPEWLTHGGIECAQSYGVAVGALIGADPLTIKAALASAIPREHIEFMDGFLDSVRFGDFLLVHAGIRPGVPLDNLGSETRWIREGFLDSSADLGVRVVHGHSVAEEVEWRDNRIGIDTGAYRTGVLTALRLEGTETEAFSARLP